MNIEKFFALLGSSAAGMGFGPDDDRPAAFIIPSKVKQLHDGSCELAYSVAPGIEIDEMRPMQRLIGHTNASESLGCKAGHLLFTRAIGNSEQAELRFRLQAFPWHAAQIVPRNPTLDLRELGRDFALLESIITRGQALTATSRRSCG